MLLLLALGCRVPTDKPPRYESFAQVELGVFVTDDQGAVDVPVEVPDDAASALVWCGPYTWDVQATASHVLDPDGATAWDAADPEGTPLRTQAAGDLYALLLPQSPDLPLRGGTWTVGLDLDTTQPTSVTCNAVFREGEAPAEALFDLRLVFVGADTAAPGFNQQEGPSNPLVQEVLERARTLLEPVGLGLGTIYYEDFEGDTKAWATVAGDEAAGTLVRTTLADQGRLELTAFLVPALEDDEGGSLPAWTPTPGLPGVGATSRSGMVLSVQPVVDGEAAVLGQRLAREALHFLGVWPTQSDDGSFTDPLADTPVCTADPDGDGLYGAADCQGQGAENLLWWSMSEGQVELTEGQAWVASRAAIAH